MGNFLKEYRFTIIFLLIIIAIIGVIVIVEVNNEKKDVKSNASSQNIQNVNKEEKNLIKPTKYQDIGDKYPIATITMEDDRKIVIKLHPEIAPTTVENFIYLANSDFYNGLIFHRTIPDFMIQGGDKEGTGMGQSDYSIVGEFEANGYENNLSHKKGTLSMARKSMPYDSATTQFFITSADVPYLDGDYAAFGEVIEGIEIVEELQNVEVVTRDNYSLEANRPVNPPVIKDISVETFGVDYSEPERIAN